MRSEHKLLIILYQKKNLIRKQDKCVNFMCESKAKLGRFDMKNLLNLAFAVKIHRIITLINKQKLIMIITKATLFFFNFHFKL